MHHTTPDLTTRAFPGDTFEHAEHGKFVAYAQIDKTNTCIGCSMYVNAPLQGGLCREVPDCAHVVWVHESPACFDHYIVAKLES